MGHRSAVVLVASLLSSAFAAAPALGQTAAGDAVTIRYPVAFAERPLTLGAAMLRGEVQVDDTRIDTGSYANLTVRGAFGITSHLVVRAVVAPLQLASADASGFRYGQEEEYPGPVLGATYRFELGPVELGLAADVGLYTTPRTTGAYVAPSIPIRFHLGRHVRLDTGLDLTFRDYSVAPSSTTLGGASRSSTSEQLIVPVNAAFSLTDSVFVGGSTGFDHVFRTTGPYTQLPLGFYAGYTVAGEHGPILDIEPFFTWFALLTPGGPSATDTGLWRLGLQVQGYFYL